MVQSRESTLIQIGRHIQGGGGGEADYMAPDTAPGRRGRTDTLLVVTPRRFGSSYMRVRHFRFCLFACFAFLWLWTTDVPVDGIRVAGGVPCVDGMRLAGGPPAAPAEDSFHFCTLSVGRIMSGELRVERSAPPT